MLRTLNVPMSLSHGGVWRKEAGGVLLMPPAPDLAGDPQETAGPQILSQLCRISGDNSWSNTDMGSRSYIYIIYIFQGAGGPAPISGCPTS